MITFSNRPDDHGFILGTADDSNGIKREISVMPPTSEWAGKAKLANYEPDDDQYVLYLDGEEIGRVDTFDDAEMMLSELLQ